MSAARRNQNTKRGLFGRTINSVRLVVGSDDLRRGEIDINRPIIPKKLAFRFSTVKSHNESWIDNVRRDFWGAYAALSYRPFPNTQIHVMAEHAETNTVNSQGLVHRRVLASADRGRSRRRKDWCSCPRPA
jgi:outer membrane receptor for monomeric catechols